MYRALITDLDGTAVKLSSNGSDVNQKMVNIIRRAHSKGKIIASATGRGWALAKPVIEALGLKDPCIIEGGTRIIDPITENTLWEKELDRSSATFVLGVFNREGPDGLLTSSHLSEWTPLKEIDALPTQMRYMYLLGLSARSAKTIVNQVNAHESLVAHLTPSWLGEDLVDVHVTHAEASKEHAIQRWLKLVGVSKQETIGMGDSGNDIPIFESVGLKVAVGNATSDLLQLADYIAPTQTDGALIHIINKFLLV